MRSGGLRRVTKTSTSTDRTFGHGVQSAASANEVEFEKVPEGHGCGAAEPRAQNEPRRHAIQLIAPLAFWYVPPSQDAHLSVLAEGAMLPARQGSAGAVPPGHANPGSHGEQLGAAPVTLLWMANVPASQVAGSGVLQPAGQR